LLAVADASLTRRVAAALAVVELTILVGPAPVRVVAGLALALILPGLAITRVLGRAQVERAEQLLLVPGMSVVIAIITGLVLNGAHVHLTRESWAISLGVVTAAGLAIGAMRERHEEVGKDPRRESARPAGAASVAGRRMRGVVVAALLAVAALAAIGALAIGALGQRYRGHGFTDLWALPGRSALSAVRLGVVSHERHEARYQIRVSVDGREVETQEITLRPGQAWQSTQPVTKPGELVEVRLDHWPHGTIYRHVRLWVGRRGG
jgi:uncharacterized membrane protein